MGRPLGAKNRKPPGLEAKIHESGLTPLEYLLDVMRNEANPPQVRLQAANAASPYIHSKPTAEIKHSGAIRFERIENVIVDPKN